MTTALSSSITYTENEKPANIKTGILSQSLKIDHNRSVHDTTLCRTFTVLIIANSEHQYKWDPIPEEKQDTTAVIRATGDAYFDRFDNINVTVELEYIGEHNLTRNSCYLGLPSALVVMNRRYVVDETMGVVDILLGFLGLDNTQGTTPIPDSHVFRVEGGKIRYVHTVSSCVTPGCGVNGTGPPF
ncbi:hypothetical protein BDZ45DRAFT_759110 [Acephala macrosclerotiorum]|nr:hypothetical protein BDZ45DRAFT_759110 [Acephala macrosclerotiorum]